MIRGVLSFSASIVSYHFRWVFAERRSRNCLIGFSVKSLQPYFFVRIIQRVQEYIVCVSCCLCCHISRVKCSFQSIYHATVVVVHSPIAAALDPFRSGFWLFWCDIDVFLSTAFLHRRPKYLMEPFIGRHRSLATSLTTWSVDLEYSYVGVRRKCSNLRSRAQCGICRVVQTHSL